MKKIAFYSRSFYTGGMENAVYNMCRLLIETGEYDITILFSVSNEKTENMMNKLATVAKIEYVAGNYKRFDVLINCDRKDFILPYISAKKTIHWFSSCLVENICNLQGKVITQSNWHRDKLKQLGIDSTVIGNPLDVAYILNKSQEKVEIIKKNDEIVYLIVARISHEKGFDRAIQFMQRSVRENSKLFIIGSPTMPNSDLIVRRIQRSLGTRAVFLGEKDNPYPYILQSDYVMCLSEHEIYGLVAEEAHILGKQVIFNHYETAPDQFIKGFDLWYDEVIKKYDNRLDDFAKSSLDNNEKRFKMWKGIIDE